MADLTFTAQMDAKGFLGSLGQMEKETRERTAKMRDYIRMLDRREDKAAAGGAVSAGLNAALKTVASLKLLKGAYGYVTEAVDVYGKKNDVVSGAMKALDSAFERLSETVGRLLGPAVVDLCDSLTDLLNWTERSAKASRRWFTEMLNGVEAADALEEAIGQEEAAVKRYAEAAKQLEQVNIADALGLEALRELNALTREASTARLELLSPEDFAKTTARNTRDDQLAKVNEQYAKLTPQQQKSFDLASLTYDINSRYNQTLAEIAFKQADAAEAARKENEAVQQTAALRYAELDSMLAGREIDTLRLNDQGSKADLAALELDYARQLNAVLADTSIHELDRLNIAERLLGIYDQQRTAIENDQARRASPESTRARTLASGLGSGLSAQVLGVGAGVANDSKAVTTATLTSAQKLTEAVTLLKQIRDKNAGAAFQ